MDYPDWKETREGMWAAELNFPMIDEETPTFMGRPHVTSAAGLPGADVVVIGAPYVSSNSDEWAGVAKEHWLAAPQRVRQQSIRYQSGYIQDFRMDVMYVLGRPLRRVNWFIRWPWGATLAVEWRRCGSTPMPTF